MNTKNCPRERADEITKRIAEMVATNLKPISIVEGYGFKHLMSYMEPGYSTPSHMHIATVCRRIYNDQKVKPKEEIASSGNVSITTDIWTNAAVDRYLILTVHFLDKLWQMQSQVLLTEEIPERHTGKNIADGLMKAVDEWNILQIFIKKKS